jgi:hypothetical protein
MADDPRPVVIPRRSVLQMLAGTAMAGAIPAVASGHPILRHLADEAALSRAQAKATAADWKPEFLDLHQFETLQSLAERLVPGAGRVKTSEFVDELLAVESSDDQRRFLSALGAFEGQARQRFSRPWRQLAETEQVAILTDAFTVASGTPAAKPWTRGEPILPPAPPVNPPPITLRDHVDLLKGWIAGAYYSSETGMRELGWTGNMFFDSFPGCSHPDGHA